jgi:nitrogen-specific signal transduction histidine kinase
VVSVASREEVFPSIEIKIDIGSTETLEIEKEKIFTPFWRMHDYQAGLGLMLARQAIHSRNGQLTFEKISSCRAQFTLLLEIPFDNIPSSTRKEENHGRMEG